MAAVENLTARLEGSIVTLEPLREEHAEELWEAAQAPEIWAWLANLNERERFDLWMRLTLEAAQAGTEGPFTTRDARTGRAIGSSRYLNVRPARPRGRDRLDLAATRAPGAAAPTSRPSC